MKAIITTFEAQGDEAVTLTLTSTGPIDAAERRRLEELFRSSTVLELHVNPSEGDTEARKARLQALGTIMPAFGGRAPV